MTKYRWLFVIFKYEAPQFHYIYNWYGCLKHCRLPLLGNTQFLASPVTVLLSLHNIPSFFILGYVLSFLIFLLYPRNYRIREKNTRIKSHIYIKYSYCQVYIWNNILKKKRKIYENKKYECQEYDGRKSKGI